MVDPVIDHFNAYNKLLEKEELKLAHVIDTHTHADHISASASLKDKHDCGYAMHKNAPSKCVTIRVDDGVVLDIKGYDMKVMYTPGHTLDSVSLIVNDLLLTGDFLF